MSYSIEQEIKAMLTANEFTKLLSHFELAFDQYQTQQNNYYDSADQKLKKAQAALRLRNFNTHSEWTFKQKQDQHRSLELTENHSYPILPVPQTITLDQLHDPVIKDQLRYLFKDDDTLELFLQIKTDRYLYHNEYGEWAIDRTYYGDTIDYEIELETHDLEPAKVAFENLLTSLAIDFRPADKKIARALHYLKQSNDH